METSLQMMFRNIAARHDSICFFERCDFAQAGARAARSGDETGGQVRNA
jgi:hypothetical protein